MKPFFFRKFLGVDSSLIQQFVTAVEETYLSGIRNLSSNIITVIIYKLLNQLKENYVRLIPHKLLDSEETNKKKYFHPRNPISNVYNSIEDIMGFLEINGTPYMQL